MLGVADGYECGVLSRIKCRLEEPGLSSDMAPEVIFCIMPAKGVCRGRLRMHLSKE